MLDRRTLIGRALGSAAALALPRAAFAATEAPFPLYDTHAHFYTNDQARYPFNARGARYGAERMIAKAMATPMTPEVIFGIWDLAGITKGCGVQYNSTYATDNRYLLDISRRYPKKIVPVVILSPLDPATPAALEKMAREDRISGVRFTGVADASGAFPFLGDAAAPAWAAADRLGLVIVLMPIGKGTEGAMARVAVLAARYPNVKIVLDHVGFPKPVPSPTFGLSPEHLALAGHKNVYYKYTTLLIEQLEEGKVPLDAFVEHVAGVYGADHLVWGSDVGNSEVDVVDYVRRAVGSARRLPVKQQRAMFFDTAEAVFIPGGRGPVRA
ncbi:MAG: amidohydrolase family protein [Sphingomonas fennica]